MDGRGYLSEDTENTEGGENDHKEGDEETNNEEKKIVADMFWVFPCGSTAENYGSQGLVTLMP